MYIDSFHLEERALEERQIRDPIDFFTSLIGGGDEEEESTTSTRTRTRTSSSTEEDEDEDEEEEETSRTRSSTRSSSSSSSTSTSSTRSSASLTSESSDTLTTPTPFVPPSRSELIVTVTSTSSNGLPSTDPANSNAREEKALTPVVIGIIVAGSVIFGLIFFALIVRKFFQARRRAKRNTWGAGNIDAFAPPVPTVIEKDEPRAAYPPPTPSRMYGSGMNEGLYGSAPVAPAPAPTPVPAPIPVARQDIVSYNSNTYGSNNYAQYPSAMPAGGPGYGPGGGGAFSPAVASSAGFNAPYPYNNNMAGGLAAGAAINRTPSPAVQIMIVCKTFAPTLPDELALTPGESVKVLNAFDDGWCKVQRLGSNEAGMVPMECLDNQSTTGGASRRASSLYNVPQQQQQQGY